MGDLTGKQQTVLRLLQEGARLNGRCPTYRQLAEELHLHLKSVHQHVLALEKRGLVSRHGRAGIHLAPHVAATRGVPLLRGRAGAGPPGTADPAVEEYVDFAHDLGLNRSDTFLLRVRGESMVKRGIQDDDIVVVRPDLPAGNGDVAAVDLGDEAIVKTIRHSSDRVLLFSEPRCGGPREIRMPQGTAPRVRGRVVAAIRFVKRTERTVLIEEAHS